MQNERGREKVDILKDILKKWCKNERKEENLCSPNLRSKSDVKTTEKKKAYSRKVYVQKVYVQKSYIQKAYIKENIYKKFIL